MPKLLLIKFDIRLLLSKLYSLQNLPYIVYSTKEYI